MNTRIDFMLPELLLNALYQLAKAERRPEEHDEGQAMNRLLNEAMAFWLEQPADTAVVAATDGSDVLMTFDLPDDLIDQYYALAVIERRAEEPDNSAALYRCVAKALRFWMAQAVVPGAPDLLTLDPDRPRPLPRPFDDLPEDPDQ